MSPKSKSYTIPTLMSYIKSKSDYTKPKLNSYPKYVFHNTSSNCWQNSSWNTIIVWIILILVDGDVNT